MQASSIDKTSASISSEELGFTCAEIDGLNLLNHNKSTDVRAFDDCHVKRVTAICTGQGANNRETRLFIKQGVAHHEGGAAPPLLMARLRIKGNGNKVPFLGKIGFHLPHLPANRLAPVNFSGLVVFGYA
jgi:hypothetical protein